MVNVSRLAAVAGCVGLSVAAGFTASAWASAGTSRGPVTLPMPTGRTLAAPTYQPSPESSFVPITPCRIVSTVASHKLGNGTVMTYYVGGTFGFTGQGGKSGGCGIPTSATAIAATVTAAQTGTHGYMRMWPANLAEPSATVLSYPTGSESTGTGATIPIQADTAHSLKVKNYNGPANLIIDVSGYYAKPLAGLISFTGSLYSGSSRLISSTRTGTGIYEVQFDRVIRDCSATATVNAAADIASTDTFFDIARPDTVQVQVRNLAGTLTDEFFYIQVEC